MQLIQLNFHLKLESELIYYVSYKNLYKINGKPLLYWSILASLRSKKINYTWVSSDSEKILNFSKKIGARILKRSKKNSSDSASSEEAWLESINEIETKYQKKIDIVVGIQPTSPIKTGIDFDKALNLKQCTILKIEKEDKILFQIILRMDHFIYLNY